MILIYVICVIAGICICAGIIAFIKELINAENTNRYYKKGFYERYIKRPLDCTLATGALIVFSPFLFVIAILVGFKLGFPIVFKQERPGRDERIFKLYKFRTMTDKRDENGELLSDEIRLTKFGKSLRASSCDELLELINIVKGDMALVGPRPLLVKYLDHYNTYQHRRHEVRPGLTGYAQAYGRNSITWEDKFEKDVYYVDHISFKGDIRIILDTVKSVLKHEGISSETSATMEEFNGSEANSDIGE